jgi:hypothetical protein
LIDPLTEDLIWPTEATSCYPRGAGGRKVHVSVVYRDMNRGRDGILLESIRTPRLATSRQAVARFFRTLSKAAGSESPSQPASATRRKNVDAVERELDRIGI